MKRSEFILSIVGLAASPLLPVNLHYDTVNNNYILMNKDSFVYVIHIKASKQ